MANVLLFRRGVLVFKDGVLLFVVSGSASSCSCCTPPPYDCTCPTFGNFYQMVGDPWTVGEDNLGAGPPATVLPFGLSNTELVGNPATGRGIITPTPLTVITSGGVGVCDIYGGGAIFGEITLILVGGFARFHLHLQWSTIYGEYTANSADACALTGGNVTFTADDPNLVPQTIVMRPYP